MFETQSQSAIRRRVATKDIELRAAVTKRAAAFKNLS
jgi:hypothetical protein